MFDFFPQVTALAVIDAVIITLVIPFVLMTKKDSTSAVAWCLVILLMPIGGALLFWVFGYTHIIPYLRRKQRHRSGFHKAHPPRRHEAKRGDEVDDDRATGQYAIARLAVRVGAFPVSDGNQVTLFADTQRAFDALLAAIAEARHHVHLEYYIFRTDDTGRQLFDLLTRKAREGVQVRVLYDSMGGWGLNRTLTRPLTDAGGRVAPFLPLNPLRSKMQVNLRNHRKIAVVDGRVGFTGGMNIGDEYLGKNPRVGYWRDEVLRLEGPAVAGLQRVFTEDWDFAAGQALDGPDYFPDLPDAGEDVVQVIESGPDQDQNSIREVYFAALTSARERVWIASPYFVPDAGLADALRLARFRDVEVRLLSLLHPDHILSFYAGRYYWSDMLSVGMKIYQYGKGMMHSKFLLVDGSWGLVGSANLDNRSMHLNFEAGCLLYTPRLIAELEESFRQDIENSVPLDAKAFAGRSFPVRLMENACRLLSPVL